MLVDERKEYPECIVCGVKRRGFWRCFPTITAALTVQDELKIDIPDYIDSKNEGRYSALLDKYCSFNCFQKHFKLAKKRARERVYSLSNREHLTQEEYSQDKLRQMLIEEDGRCRVCGDNRVVELHHIIPQEFGGRTVRGNCVLLCPTCHALTRGQGFIS